MPDPLDTQWPISGFMQLRKEHQILLPKLTLDQIEGYLLFRMACDREATKDLKALEKGKNIFEAHRIMACSYQQSGESTYFSGIVGAAMKHKVTYNYKIRVKRSTGEPMNSHCECPAGKGPHGTCKHIAAVLLMLEHFIKTGNVQVEKCCTDTLQTFHKPKAVYNGSPVKAVNIPSKRKHLDNILEDPRPQKYRNVSGYNDFVRNAVVNYCSFTSMDIAMRYVFPKANLQQAVHDHDYLQKPFHEYWIDKALAVSEKECRVIEKTTRNQSKSTEWFHHRKWRLTASRFGEILKMTSRRNKTKLCQSLYQKNSFITLPLLHGKQFEAKALLKFETLKGLKCRKAGLFVRPDFPFLGASPDAILDDDKCVEIKCPYNGRNEAISPGKNFPFLKEDCDGEVTLSKNSQYYSQVQGQMFIARKTSCYFIVYTFVDIFVQLIPIDEEFCLHSLVPKLSLFYEKYFRPFLASQL